MSTTGLTPAVARHMLDTLERLGNPAGPDAPLLDQLRHLASQPAPPLSVGCTVCRRGDPARTGTVLALWGDRARVRWHLITGGIKSGTSVCVRGLERFD